MMRVFPTSFGWVVVAALSGGSLPALSAGLSSLERIEQEVSTTQGHLQVVRDLMEKSELGGGERARQRYLEAESQFLLDNFEGAAALLFEATAVPAFRQSPDWSRALYYLAESLYQNGSLSESRRTFREALSVLPSAGYEAQQSLLRLISLAERSGDASGVEAAYAASVRMGRLRPDVVYHHARWLARRGDVPPAQRLGTADTEFASLLPGQPWYLQSVYWRGVLRVGAGQLAESLPFWDQVRAATVAADDTAGLRVQTLARVQKARVLADLGRHAEALQEYAAVDRDGPDSLDALYESALVSVRMGDLTQAQRLAESVVAAGLDSPLVPEARLLSANLLLRQGLHEEAVEAFDQVGQEYSPVRDQVLSLTRQPDPEGAFDKVLRERGDLDLAQVLPPEARPFLGASEQLRRARGVATDTGLSRQAAQEAEREGRRVLESLIDTRVSTFAPLREGDAQTVQISNRLTVLERELVRLQRELLGRDLPADVQEELDRLDRERAVLDRLMAQLPQTEEQFRQRQSGFVQRAEVLERESFELRLQVDYVRANLSGLEKYWSDTRKDRRVDPEDEKERQSEFEQYRALIQQLDEQRTALATEVIRLRTLAAGEAAGGQREDQLRQSYHEQLATMQQIITRVAERVSPSNRASLERADRLRREIADQQSRVRALRDQLRSKAQTMGDALKRQVQAELDQLSGSIRGVDELSRETGELLGQVAVSHLDRVGRRFDDLVLQSDVGLIDVAWARKKERSDRISGMARDKEADIQELQKRYSEVLGDD